MKFFFQAEDGIRDIGVTGVQTCALPIWQKGQTEVYRGHELTVNLLRKVQLQIAVNEDFVEPTVNAIMEAGRTGPEGDRKSTRLNSSHANISYAVFCLKKKNNYTVDKNIK